MNPNFSKINRDRNYGHVKMSNTTKIPRYRNIASIGGPRGTSGQEGNIILNKSDKNFYGHNGERWVRITGAQQPIGPTGPTGPARVGSGALIENTSIGAPTLTFTVSGNAGVQDIPTVLTLSQNMTTAVLFFTCYIQTSTLIQPNQGFFLQWRFNINGIPNTTVYVLDPVGNSYTNSAAQTRTVSFYFPTSGLSAGDTIGVSARTTNNAVGWDSGTPYPVSVRAWNGNITVIGN